MSNGVYFSASARLQKVIAVSSHIIRCRRLQIRCILLPVDILTSGIRIPAREYEVLPCSQLTIFIIVATALHVSITPAIKNVKSSGPNKSPCLTPMVEESRRLSPSTSNRTSIDLCIARSTEISFKGTPNRSKVFHNHKSSLGTMSKALTSPENGPKFRDYVHVSC